MKTFVLFLFISASAFSQTKKEMRTEIDLLKSEQAHINLGHQIEMNLLIKKVDSLKTLIAGQNDQLQADHLTILRLREELADSKDSLAHLNNLLIAKQPKEKEEKTKIATSQKSETDKTSLNPFGSGGTGGKRSADSADPIEKEEASGHGAFAAGGTGNGRTRLNDVSINHIESDRDEIIYLKLTIDESGNVISCISTSKTTTTNQQLINQVKQAVIQQVKFSKSPGSEPVSVYYTVKIASK